MSAAGLRSAPGGALRGIVRAPGDKGSLPFWEVGYGFVNLDRAVALVTAKNWAGRLASAAARADQRVRKADGVQVLRSDFFVHDAPPVTAGSAPTSPPSTCTRCEPR